MVVRVSARGDHRRESGGWREGVRALALPPNSWRLDTQAAQEGSAPRHHVYWQGFLGSPVMLALPGTSILEPDLYSRSRGSCHNLPPALASQVNFHWLLSLINLQQIKQTNKNKYNKGSFASLAYKSKKLKLLCTWTRASLSLVARASSSRL